jgi:hypothetical protein
MAEGSQDSPFRNRLLRNAMCLGIVQVYQGFVPNEDNRVIVFDIHIDS